MLLEILSYSFFHRALLAGVCIGILAPLVGMCFVARRQAFFADTLAHASLAGVALGGVFGIHGVFSALSATLVASLGMEMLRRYAKIPGDAALALILSGSLACAVVLFSMTGSWNAQVLSYLFGSILTVTWQDIFLMFFVGGFVSLFLFFGRDRFFAMTAHPDLAQVQGIPVARYELLFAVLSAFVVAVGMRVVGALLVSALLVIPVLSASLWKYGFWCTALLASLYGVVGVIFGLFFSAFFDVPSGASIVLFSLALFLVTQVFVRK